jgi:uncharacterized protein YdeI (YjbR/CyaY-like superfamily)
MTSRETTSHDPRVDAYIASSADFAKPILEYLRARVHESCPDVEETIKWGMPTFMHAGGILCGMAAFKRHASFGFWKHALVVGDGSPAEGMGSFGKLSSVADLPAKRQLLAYLKKAVRLNEQGVRTPAARKIATPKPLPEVPADFAAALHRNAAAKTTFKHFVPSHRREYLEWILDAKREETRASDRTGHGMACGRQTPELEIRKLLKRLQRSASPVRITGYSP